MRKKPSEPKSRMIHVRPKEESHRLLRILVAEEKTTIQYLVEDMVE